MLNPKMAFCPTSVTRLKYFSLMLVGFSFMFEASSNFSVGDVEVGVLGPDESTPLPFSLAADLAEGVSLKIKKYLFLFST